MNEQDKRDVVGHLQAAAKELIAAARDALDMADEVVSDRIRFATLLARRRGGNCAPGGVADTAEPKVEKIEVTPS